MYLQSSYNELYAWDKNFMNLFLFTDLDLHQKSMKQREISKKNF